MVLAHERLPDDTHQLAFIHDELQYECPQMAATEVAEILKVTAEEAGQYYKMRIPTTADAKIGKTWADVH